jgi:hypothetical protein
LKAPKGMQLRTNRVVLGLFMRTPRSDLGRATRRELTV